MSGSKKRRKDKMKPRPDGRGFVAKDKKKKRQPGWLKSFFSQKVNRLRPFISRNKLVIRSCAIFLAIVIIFIFIYSRLVNSQLFEGFMGFTARVTGIFLSLLGSDVVVRGTLVSSSEFGYRIVDLCTAIMPMMIFTAAVIAFPSKIKQKTVGLLIGFIGIFFVNQIRLVSLYYIGLYIPSIFDTAHLLVWQSLMILLAIGLWLLWIYKYVRTSTI